MKTFKTIQRTRAFMLVEMVVAIAIISIIATLVTINFTESRRTARDGNRKTDISTVLSAVTQYATTNGTTLVKMKSQPCNTSAPATEADEIYSGGGCTGASGRAYGKINLSTSTTQGDGLNNPGRTYANTTIVEALKEGGYFNVDPKDPFNKEGRTTDVNAKDYVLIRACPNGQQHVGTGGQLVAVWTYLERDLSDTEKETKKKLVGSTTAIDTEKIAEWGDHYDFAAGTEYGKYDSRGYAVSNGVANWNLSATNCQPRSPIAQLP